MFIAISIFLLLEEQELINKKKKKKQINAIRYKMGYNFLKISLRLLNF